MNPITSLISSAFAPVSKLIDDLHTSDEERLTIKQSLFSIQSELTVNILEYYGKLVKAQSDIIVAESQGQSWMQRNWRPITMLTFLALVVCDSFGWLENRLAEDAWDLLKIGLGGYVVGRSAEKIAPQITKIMRKD